MAKQNNGDEPFIGLSKALRQMKATYPECAPSAIREAVKLEKIPSRRSSDKKQARYSVQVSALVQWYLNAT